VLHALSSVLSSQSPVLCLALCFAAALATAALLWACYFPLACGWLGWVALVPLLYLVRSRAPAWWIYLCAWAAGLGFFWPVLQWMRVADSRMYYTWATLATYCALYFPLAIFLLRRLDRGTALPLTVTVPVVWTALDFFRANFIGAFAWYFTGHMRHNLPGGFAWYFLGYTQHSFLAVIQIADLVGVYGVTFVVATVNGLLFEMAYSRFKGEGTRRRRVAVSLQAVVVILLLGVVLVYGVWRLGQEEFAPGPRLSLLQSNIDQRIRNNAASAEGDSARRVIIEESGVLCRKARELQPRPNLIVWPETSFPDEWNELAPAVPVEQVNPLWRKGLDAPRLRARGVVEYSGTNVLFGVNRQVWGLNDQPKHVRADYVGVLAGAPQAGCPSSTPWAPLFLSSRKGLRPTERSNSALLMTADGEEAGRYDKMHRVPFGEYVPLRDWLPWMNQFAPYDFDYSIIPGEEFTRFPLGDYAFGVVICYEDTDPYLARQYVRPDRDRPVDFLINISNDGWFNGTSEHEEHLAICRFRAIECRRAVARSVNMGISAVIDGNGRVCALPGPTWAESKKTAAVLTANIPIDRRTSIYAAWGDWLPWTCWGFIGMGCVYSWARRRLDTSPTRQRGFRGALADASA
jgi:apolipoprotein N-acyltransferase